MELCFPGKLRLCQEERDRIKREQERRERDVIGDFTKKTRRSHTKQTNGWYFCNKNAHEKQMLKKQQLENDN